MNIRKDGTKCAVTGCRHAAQKYKKYCKKHSDLDVAEANRFKKKCLKCGRSFRSTSKFNRICSVCKNTHEWRYGENFDY